MRNTLMFNAAALNLDLTTQRNESFRGTQINESVCKGSVINLVTCQPGELCVHEKITLDNLPGSLVERY